MRKVLIIGSGRSGRGMLGELLSHEEYETTFSDIDVELTDGLKEQGYYTVKKTNLATKESEETKVEGFKVLNTINNHVEYIRALATSDFVLTALKPDAFDQVIKDIVEAVRYRMTIKLTYPTFITLGANYVGLYEKFSSGIYSMLSNEEHKYFDSNIYLVMSIVNRKNRLPDIVGEDKYRVEGDDKPVLRVEDIPQLVECEYKPKFFKLEHNLSAAMAIKIWSGNVVQCTMAFVALHKNMTGSYEASMDLDASRIAYYAADEAYQGVAAEYGLSPRTDEQKEYPVTVFRNEKFSDSLYRIAREPIRKLGKNDRFIGPALCALKHGILPYYICLGAAYGFFYVNNDEPEAVELQKYVEQNGIENAILKYTDLDLENANEKIVYELILGHYRNIANTNPIKM